MSGSKRKARAAEAEAELAAMTPEEALDSYQCTICLDVQRAPMETKCGHVFCSACITALISGATSPSEACCPVCRKACGANPKQARDHGKRRAMRVQCYCGSDIPLLDWREHSETCRAVAAKSEAEAAHVARPQNAPPAGPNRSTFACPLCDAKNLPRAAFVEHLQNEHGASAMQPAVCPICAAMPWGDSSYRSANLLQHVQMRHQFDYDTTTDYGQSEEDVLAEVLRRSQTEC